MLKRPIGLTRLVELIHCLKFGLTSLSMTSEERDSRNLRQLVGDATAKLLAGRPAQEVTKLISDSLGYDSPSLVNSIIEEATILANRAPESKLVDKDNDKTKNLARSEQQFFLPFEGRTVALKPDRWRFVDENGRRWPCMDKGRYPRGFNPRKHTRILRVIDYKAKDLIDAADWERAELMTLGTRLCLGWTGPTQMVLYPLRSGLRSNGTEEAPVSAAIRWWNPLLPDGTRSTELEDKARADLSAALRYFDEALQKRDLHLDDPVGYPDDGFPATPGGQCFGCPARFNCSAGQAFMRLRLSEHAAARNAPLPQRKAAGELEQACFIRGSKRMSVRADQLFNHIGHVVLVRLGKDTKGRFRQLKDLVWVDGGMVKLVFDGGLGLTASPRDRYDVCTPPPDFVPSGAVQHTSADAHVPPEAE
jgi:hypothetical protein